MSDVKEINIADSELVKRLFTEHLDGLLLIDSANGNLVKVSDEITGKLLPLAKFDGTHFDEIVRDVVQKRIPEGSRAAVTSQLLLSTVREKLQGTKIYDVDFNMRDVHGKLTFHCLRFEYLDESKKYIVLVSEDVSRVVSGEIDPLTGGLNATGFYNKVNKWLADNPDRKYRVMRYNVDRFRDINGVYGHDVGDQLLRDITECMRALDSEDSFSAHLNADHFVRFCADDRVSEADCYNNFTRSFSNYKLSIPINLHIGVYDLCEPGITPFDMSYKALLAMQSIKGDLNNRICRYQVVMLSKEQEQLEILNDVDEAIARDQFEVWFQPQVDYAQKKIVGAEALVRWNHPEKGLISPASFIPVLEKSNYISKVDRYVFHKTCKYLQRWLAEMPNIDVQISVNLSRQDILLEGFVDSLDNAVQSYGIPRKALHLEVTESAYVEEAARLNAEVDKLRNRGFWVEIDDFGTGYSSLNTLKDINVDKLKLDMKFLSGDGGRKERIIIAAVIDMAKTLGLSVLAEGVETKEQADMLLGFGCNEMQGYYFSKPVPASEYEELLRGNKTLQGLK